MKCLAKYAFNIAPNPLDHDIAASTPNQTWGVDIAGEIIFRRFEPETSIVYFYMRGACAGCPSSAYTLKMGIENMLRTYVPEVTAVEAAI